MFRIVLLYNAKIYDIHKTPYKKAIGGDIDGEQTICPSMGM